jgi:hypothetical protein
VPEKKLIIPPATQVAASLPRAMLIKFP